MTRWFERDTGNGNGMDSCKQCFTDQYCTVWLRRSDIDKKNIRDCTLFAYALVRNLMRWWWWKMKWIERWSVIHTKIRYRTIIHSLHLKWCTNNNWLILCKMIIPNGKNVCLHRFTQVLHNWRDARHWRDKQENECCKHT